ncbi:MAG: histidine kinase [Liquorilactobacillus nagelii]|jgi:signal transduction histidine kinase|uniref:sensor histidine kinase n=1 Tax=Liquorilactobacillus nagelii TaxID=82688 RepID=UPI00242A6418|nr:histidine kinase [Liquorilactobacillus nagelii]MCI1922341.1 histidine kinase [Liquorilactobacillus nagelii]MCI1977783.1 histidine kinase [Liquorilactobacillus nagelii]
MLQQTTFKKLSLPLFVWLVLLFLTTFYLHINLYNEKNQFWGWFAVLQTVVACLIYFYRIKSPKTKLSYLLISSFFYLLICLTYQMAAIILVIGFLPLILADCYFYFPKKPWLVSYMIVGLLGYTFWFLTKYYHLINTLLSFDGILLFTGILIYYAMLFKRLVLEREKNRLLNEQLDQAYHGLEKMVVTRERAKFAQDLHDSVTQDLIAISVQLEGIGQQLSTAEQTEFADKIKKVRNFSDQAQKNLRSEIQRLKATQRQHHRQEQQVFMPVINSFKQKYHLDIMYSSSDQSLRLKAALELTRILTETLNNVVRHAKSHEVVVLTKCEQQKYRLIVTDFGRGMQPNQKFPTDHFGLYSIKNTVRDMGGKVLIKSSLGEGTRVVIELPREVVISE